MSFYDYYLFTNFTTNCRFRLVFIQGPTWPAAFLTPFAGFIPYGAVMVLILVLTTTSPLRFPSFSHHNVSLDFASIPHCPDEDPR